MAPIAPNWNSVDAGGRTTARTGLSLLEVLIACGILALGLSGVAAMIPAAGMRFGEATVADRARFLAANGHADMLNSGLTAASGFAGGSAVGFGHVALASGSPIASAGGMLPDPRIFATEDELVFDDTVPVNVFAAGGIGQRSARESLVWGATLVPVSLPAARGGGAVLTVAVFRRTPAAKLVTLTGRADGSWQCAEADRLQFLKACSAVFHVQSGGSAVRPSWLAVRASWPGGVVLSRDASGPTDSIQVVGFENLVRVEHHMVTLQ